jgi:hypothetical protein
VFSIVEVRAPDRVGLLYGITLLRHLGPDIDKGRDIP